ncbi:hypothetical protein [Auraticoccus monumenti]|uniref:hypothetical protein n=1 Tax=Auraticoccus monumenti TaxID=675864 RepID=UPI0012F8A4F2|nr:hypothetical protein [Auraticoccus monumenti]
MPDEPWSTAELAEALSPLLVGTRGLLRPRDCTVLDVRPREHDVLVRFRWMSYPHVLGRGLPPRSQYTEDGGSLEPRYWASDALTWFDEQLCTGLLVTASRRERPGFIELVDRPGPAADRRFCTTSTEPDDEDVWSAVDLFEQDGFDTRPVRAIRADGSLIAWVRAHLDSRTGSPWVGHAAVTRTGATTARLEFCEVAGDVPGTVVVDLCRTAAHIASWHGAQRVVTSLGQPELSILGFVQRDDHRELDTAFLGEDHEAVGALIRGSRAWKPSGRVRRAALLARLTHRVVGR